MIGTMGADLVMLPGLDGTAAFFGPFVECAPQGVSMQVVEYPQVAENTYESLLAWVRRGLPATGDFVLLGWSFSGPLALMLGAEETPGLRGLVLVGSFARRPVRWLPPWTRHLVSGSLMKMYPMASMGKALVAGYSTPELRALQARAFRQVSAEAMAARTQALLAVDARPVLRRCRVPILYLRSRNDRVVAAACGDEIVATAPDARLVELDAPHLSLTTHPRAAWSSIAPFLEGLAR